MKTQKVLLMTLTLLLTLASQATATGGGSVISSNSSDFQSDLGYGWDPNTQLLKGGCVIGDVKAVGKSQSNLDFKQTISYTQLEKELGVGGAGRARIGIVDVSASAKFLSNSKSDAFSIVAIYQGDYLFKNQMIQNEQRHPNMKDLDDLKWEESCGYEYIQQLKLGAKIFFSIRIDFTSSEEKRAFESTFSAEAPLWSVSASLKTASREFSKRSTVTISALQIGGEVDKLSGIFGDEQNLVSCSVGDFEKCQPVLIDALKYATDEFPKQISKETHRSKEGTGPVVLSYLTKPYSNAGMYPKAAPELLAEVKRQRKVINQYLTEWHSNWVFANRYGRRGGRRLSPRQTRLVQESKHLIDENLERIVEVAQSCYDKPDMSCVEMVNELNPATGSNPLKPLDPSTFIIENETFAQFCDDGMSPGDHVPPGLRASIKAYIEAAKEEKAEAFMPPEEGAPMDECYIAGRILRGMAKIEIKSKGVTDIRPLMECTELEVLDLSDNGIRSLKALLEPVWNVIKEGVFPSLRKLILHNNKIDSLEGAEKLQSLEYIDLSNNRVLNAAPLEQLPRIIHVDLRNNGQDITHNFPARVTVLTADHGSSPQSVEVSRNDRIKRYGHQASKLPNGEVFVTGGVLAAAAKIGAEIFNPVVGDFRLEPSMNEARTWHTQTTLADGTVLLAGGLSHDSAEIYDPATRKFRMLKSKMYHPRAAHTATLLQNGKVLVTGGWRMGSFSDTAMSAEIYDPKTETFSTVAQGLSVPRAGHTATLLSDGRVLLLGGINDSGTTNSADIYDPATNRIESLSRRMTDERGFHTANLLPNGTVIVIGGIAGGESNDSAEIFDPAQNRFTLVKASLKFPRMGHQTVLMNTGVVLVLGGSTAPEVITDERTCKSCLNEIEVYDTKTQDFVLSNYSMEYARVFHTVTETKPNHFLILGGLGKGAPESAEILGYSAPNERR